MGPSKTLCSDTDPVNAASCINLKKTYRRELLLKKSPYVYPLKQHFRTTNIPPSQWKVYICDCGSADPSWPAEAVLQLHTVRSQRLQVELNYLKISLDELSFPMWPEDLLLLNVLTWLWGIWVTRRSDAPPGFVEPQLHLSSEGTLVGFIIIHFIIIYLYIYSY